MVVQSVTVAHWVSANSGVSVVPCWEGTGRPRSGTRRKYVHVGYSTASMPWSVPPEDIRPPPSMDREMRIEEQQPRALLISCGHRPSVGGRSGWVCGTVKNMDVFDEPPWVKAHCLRGTASRATERPTAGGWAGPRRGIHGVSRKPTPTGPSTESDDHRLFAEIPGQAQTKTRRCFHRRVGCFRS